MAEQQALPGAKRKRNRRNFAKEIADIQAYCFASVDILASQPVTEFGNGQIAAFEKIQSKIGGNSNGRGN